jgi:hypothetical protein
MSRRGIIILVFGWFAVVTSGYAEDDFWEMETAEKANTYPYAQAAPPGAGYGAYHPGSGPSSQQGAGLAGGYFGGTDNQQGHTFSGPMERLLNMAGEPTKPDHWSDFEQVDKLRPEEEYNATFRWRMEEEIGKPLEKDSPFGDRFQDLQQRLKEMRSKRQEDKYLERYKR